MQTPKGVLRDGERMVVLDEHAGDAELFEGRGRIDFGKPATGVAVAFGTDKLNGGGHGGRVSFVAFTCNRHTGRAYPALPKKRLGRTPATGVGAGRRDRNLLQPVLQSIRSRTPS